MGGALALEIEERTRSTSGVGGSLGSAPSAGGGFSTAFFEEGTPAAALQTLLAGAVSRAARDTGCTRACAWMRHAGHVFVAAASYVESAPAEPTAEDRASLGALLRREYAVDLGEARTDPGLRALAERHGFHAARPLGGREGEGIAVIFVGGGTEEAGRVRPRTLALLDELARRLEPSIATLAATERLAALDDELRRLDRLTALGDLLAEVVHEIRNPLVSVKTFLQLLPGREQDEEFTGEYREVVVDEVLRLERLLDSVVQHARPRATSGAEPATEVAGCLAAIGGLLKHRALDRQIVLEVDTPPDLPPVHLTEDGLRQVLINLVLNAIEVTPSGGRVTLRGRCSRDAVELCVEDQGPGVPPEQRSKVFEPFYSTRSERTGGLGLAITRRLVEECGGHIDVVDAPGGGARFRVELPSAQRRG